MLYDFCDSFIADNLVFYFLKHMAANTLSNIFLYIPFHIVH